MKQLIEKLDIPLFHHGYQNYNCVNFKLNAKILLRVIKLDNVVKSHWKHVFLWCLFSFLAWPCTNQIYVLILKKILKWHLHMLRHDSKSHFVPICNVFGGEQSWVVFGFKPSPNSKPSYPTCQKNWSQKVETSPWSWLAKKVAFHSKGKLTQILIDLSLENQAFNFKQWLDDPNWDFQLQMERSSSKVLLFRI